MMHTSTFSPGTYTGRQLVTFRPGMSPEAMIKSLRKLAGIPAASTSDGASIADITVADATPWTAAGLCFDTIGVAVVDADPDQTAALQRSAGRWSKLRTIEQERWFCALDYSDEHDFTWGLQACGLRHTHVAGGRDMRIAVLDTGFDATHPSWTHDGRQHIHESFVPNEDANDGHGHGTHCAGTAAGAVPRHGEMRFGVSAGAQLLTGKVLSSQGYGMNAWILAGIEWAIRQQATVISMSLGGDVRRGAPHSPAFEAAAQAALEAGSLIVAAAGNAGDSPVGSPANCPSVLAVAAVDPRLRRASFSSIGYSDHKSPNVAAPGVGVYSTVPTHREASGFASWSGTSMATPHVAGVAALWAAVTGLRGRDLWRKLETTCRGLDLPREHVGVGLVQAPV